MINDGTKIKQSQYVMFNQTMQVSLIEK